jgi:hypothetical protein
MRRSTPTSGNVVIAPIIEKNALRGEFHFDCIHTFLVALPPTTTSFSTYQRAPTRPPTDRPTPANFPSSEPSSLHSFQPSTQPSSQPSSSPPTTSPTTLYHGAQPVSGITSYRNYFHLVSHFHIHPIFAPQTSISHPGQPFDQQKWIVPTYFGTLT